MKIAIFFLALFHSVFMLNQDTAPTKYTIHNATLCKGDSMFLGDISIKFKKIVSDSRCPNGKGITCIWAGEVKVLVEFYENGEFKGDQILSGSNILVGENEIIMGSNSSISDFFKLKGLDISSLVVTPYPESSYKISQDEYSVELKISEAVKEN